MNQKELKIISHLRKDARASLASVSNEIQIPISTTYDKINRLQQNNIIKRFTTLVDFSKLGYHHHSKLALRVPREQKGELLSFLQKNFSVNSLHEINGGFDFMVEIIHQNIKEHLAFIEKLQECFDIIEMLEFQIIKEVESEKFLGLIKNEGEKKVFL